eukprot:m.75639 g.75639  ORF g.75639 m.75639 type:complete len:1785 (-) comp12454_c3_seq2:1079-6433(-)
MACITLLCRLVPTVATALYVGILLSIAFRPIHATGSCKSIQVRGFEYWTTQTTQLSEPFDDTGNVRNGKPIYLNSVGISIDWRTFRGVSSWTILINSGTNVLAFAPGPEHVDDDRLEWAHTLQFVSSGLPVPIPLNNFNITCHPCTATHSECPSTLFVCDGSGCSCSSHGLKLVGGQCQTTAPPNLQLTTVKGALSNMNGAWERTSSVTELPVYEHEDGQLSLKYSHHGTWTVHQFVSTTESLVIAMFSSFDRDPTLETHQAYHMAHSVVSFWNQSEFSQSQIAFQPKYCSDIMCDTSRQYCIQESPSDTPQCVCKEFAGYSLTQTETGEEVCMPSADCDAIIVHGFSADYLNGHYIRMNTTLNDRPMYRRDVVPPRYLAFQQTWIFQNDLSRPTIGNAYLPISFDSPLPHTSSVDFGWLEYYDSAWRPAAAILACAGCLDRECPNNLMCIYDMDVGEHSNFTHAAYCGCEPPMVLTSSGAGDVCEHPSQFCTALAVQHKTYTNIDNLNGIYQMTGIDPVTHRPAYKFGDAVFHYSLQNRQWQFVVDGKAVTYCSSSTSDILFDLCGQWTSTFYNADGSGTFYLNMTITCYTCDQIQCGFGQTCVTTSGVPACVCDDGFVAVDGVCVKLSDYCPVLELQSSITPGLNSTLYLTSTIIANRPVYKGRSAFGILRLYYEQTSEVDALPLWHLQLLDDNSTMAAGYGSSQLPLSAEMTFKVRNAKGRFVNDENFDLLCSKCFDHSEADTLPLIPQSPSCTRADHICKTDGTTPLCMCPPGFRESEEREQCELFPDCASVTLNLKSNLFTFALTEQDLNGTQVFHTNSSAYSLFLYNDPLFGEWYVATEVGGDPLATMTGSAYYPHLSATPFTVTQGFLDVVGLGSAFGDVTTLDAELACTPCEPFPCGDLQLCGTTVNNTFTCSCKAGTESTFANDTLTCNVPTFDTCETVLVQTSVGDWGGSFSVTYDDMFQARHIYYNSKSNLFLFGFTPSSTVTGWAINKTIGSGTLVEASVVTSAAYPQDITAGTSWKFSFLTLTDVTVKCECARANVTSVVSSATSAIVTLRSNAAPGTYIVNVRTVETKKVTRSEVELTSGQTTLNVTGLTPMTHYSLGVWQAEAGCVEGELLSSFKTLSSAPTVAPVCIFTVASATTIHARCSVQSSSTVNATQLMFAFSLQDENNPERAPLTTVTQDSTTLLSDLDPYTTYGISVAATVGLLSSPLSTEQRVTTLESAPTKAPTIASVSVTEEADELHFVVNPPPSSDRNGVINSLNLVCEDDNGAVVISEGLFVSIAPTDKLQSITMTVEITELVITAQTCTIIAKNSAGSSPSSAQFTIPESVKEESRSNNSGSMSGSTIAVVVVLVVLLIVLVIGFFAWKRRDKQLPNDMIDAAITINPMMHGALQAIAIEQRDVTMRGKLGEGEFGVVCQGIWTRDANKKKISPGRQVAVKFLKEDMDTTSESIFLNEAVRMMPLKHPHVVQLLAVNISSKPNFIVVEFMERGDLKNYLKQCRPINGGTLPSLDQMCNFSIQVCRGLDYLREQNFVHRDLAARNIMINANLVLKIGDFGMARNLQQSDYYRVKSGVLPLRWMAPESVLQQRFTHLSDVYAFGVVMFEIITAAELPWAGLSDDDVIEKLRAGQHMNIKHIPNLFRAIIMACWEPCESRPPSSKVLQELISLQATIDPSMAHQQQQGALVDGSPKPASVPQFKRYRDTREVQQSLAQPSRYPNVAAQPATQFSDVQMQPRATAYADMQMQSPPPMMEPDAVESAYVDVLTDDVETRV